MKINMETKSDRKIEKIIFRNEVEIPSTTYATFGLYRYPAKLYL